MGKPRTPPQDSRQNGDMPPPTEGVVTVPDDSLLVMRDERGEFGWVINGSSTVPPHAWPTVLRRIAVLLERQLVEG